MCALDVPGQSLNTVGSNAFAGMTWLNSIVGGNSADSGLWYRPDGTAVEHPAAGLYIHNGKKVIVR